MSPADRQENELLASSGIDRTAGYLLAGLGLLLFFGLMIFGLSRLDLGPVRLDTPSADTGTAPPQEIGGLHESELHGTSE